MKVNQGLLNWLNAVNNDNRSYGESTMQTKTGLLLAPINTDQHEYNEDTILIHEINEPQNTDERHETEDDSRETVIHFEEHVDLPKQEDINEPEEHEIESNNTTEEHEDNPQAFTEITEVKEHENDSETHKITDESQELNTLIGIPDDIVKNSAIKEAEAITQELQTLKNEIDSVAHYTDGIRETTHVLDLNKAWHEANAGLELSMKEPPPQIWSSQNESESESEDEENENNSEDYEHIILQQNSSVTLHGTNFTQRLQRTLQGRKNKAAELRRKNSEDNKHSHPYIKHAFFMCAFMLLALGLAWLSLRYLQTKTPDSFNMRASELYEQGKYDEAMNLWQEAYNRYPNDIRFLEGIARSAEKAGHSQTANIAWNEYRNAIHENQSRDIEAPNQNAAEVPEVPQTLKININTGGDKKESKTESRVPVNILTFDDYLNEANRLYNIGMYTRALVNFMKALEQRNDDIRPYIGLAESYRAKGIDFEARRILAEAERRFGRNPTIETLKKLLKGSK